MTAEADNGAEFIKLCERLFAMFGKVQLVLDRASYRVSRKADSCAEANAGRLKLHFALKYAPSDNIAERRRPAVKAGMANKQARSRGHMAQPSEMHSRPAKSALPQRTPAPGRRPEVPVKRRPPAFRP